MYQWGNIGQLHHWPAATRANEATSALCATTFDGNIPSVVPNITSPAMSAPNVQAVVDGLHGLKLDDIQVDKFPAPWRDAHGLVNGEETSIMCTDFQDKILFTISQGGRLAQWVRLLHLMKGIN